ncbi:MAG: hypothetical protein ACOYVD_01980 [Bacillota bacterium]
MPVYFFYPIYTAIFSLILLVLVPGKDIRRLSIYGIIFGGLMDVFMLTIGKATGLFGWINYGPFGFIGYSIFASGSWAIFYILYFYFLPKSNLLIYIYAGAGIFFSILYTNLVINLDIFYSYNRIFLPLAAFIVWFSIATWGYTKLSIFILKNNTNRKLFKLASRPVSNFLSEINFKKLTKLKKPSKLK